GTAELGNRSDLFWVCTLRVDEDNDANKAVLNLPDGELPRSYLQASEIKEARFVPYKQLHEITDVPKGGTMWCVYEHIQRYIDRKEGGIDSMSLAGQASDNQRLYFSIKDLWDALYFPRPTAQRLLPSEAFKPRADFSV
ncbi:nudix (nucleoside diphosphate linked moiety X)-type motif 6, partial [Perkinsus olseni]